MQPAAPRLTAPLPQGRDGAVPASQPPPAPPHGSQEVIPATQPPRDPTPPSAQPQASKAEEVIVVASQPAGGRKAPRAAPKKPAPKKAPRKKPAPKKQSTGAQSGMMPSIRRRRSAWEGVELEGAPATATSSASAVPESIPTSTEGSTAPRAPVLRPSSTGITKTGGTRNAARVTRSSRQGASGSSGQSQGAPKA